MLLWSCDALLPINERYASISYRRFARRFNATKVDYDSACELVAFIETIGFRWCKYLFLWRAAGLREASRLHAHLKDRDIVKAMVSENMARVTRDDGLACLQAMREGGWYQGAVPAIVRLALLDMRASGISQPKIGKMLGLTHDQVRVMANGRRRGRRPSHSGAFLAE